MAQHDEQMVINKITAMGEVKMNNVASYVFSAFGKLFIQLSLCTFCHVKTIIFKTFFLFYKAEEMPSVMNSFENIFSINPSLR